MLLTTNKGTTFRVLNMLMLDNLQSQKFSEVRTTVAIACLPGVPSDNDDRVPWRRDVRVEHGLSMAPVFFLERPMNSVVENLILLMKAPFYGCRSYFQTHRDVFTVTFDVSFLRPRFYVCLQPKGSCYNRRLGA